ncbi:tyrosine-type recombinase/integrase [Roseiconus lacunae]|uniref:tyrosine-type recombinase/integrase n=1 Tax=Roseiconus lacunae TaxID=2605694 RepID=UPI001E52B02E|nr:site-specific integrase [Roseiconus lacunae]MCD0457942.1 site-specific integrase [Roseiconus lacunae]
MASLHKENDRGRKGWRIRYRDVNKRPKSIWLGQCSKKSANDAFRHISELVDARANHGRPDNATVKWAEKLDGKLRDRLEALDLIEVSTAIQELPKTVIAYMRAYIKSRTDWKKPENYKQAVDKLETHLGKDIPLTSLTKGDADRWHRWMIDTLKLSTNTAGQNVKRCRQMMRQAVADRLADENVFSEVKIDLRSDQSKNRFIDDVAAEAILEACGGQEWRTLFALCRFGGLRCPSEVLRMKWTDIVWDRDRFRVTSPKTARYGKGERVVPLFPELRIELEALLELQQSRGDSSPYVIGTFRDTETNLRKRFAKIVENAGVEAFPKPFMALRASRRTELERTGRFPNHVLNDWFGHSGAVAETHYLQTTEADFTEAAGGNAGGNKHAKTGESASKDDSPKPNKKRPQSLELVDVGRTLYTPEDSNL